MTPYTIKGKENFFPFPSMCQGPACLAATGSGLAWSRLATSRLVATHTFIKQQPR